MGYAVLMKSVNIYALFQSVSTFSVVEKKYHALVRFSIRLTFGVVD